MSERYRPGRLYETAGNGVKRTRDGFVSLVVLMVVLCITADAGAQGPQLNYVEHCMGCHKLDGAGSLQNNVPDMRGTVGHFLRLPQGRDFLIQVAGIAQAPLDDAALTALINWMVPAIGADSVPPDFTPFTVEEVARLRTNRPADINALRESLRAELALMGHDIDHYREPNVEE